MKPGEAVKFQQYLSGRLKCFLSSYGLMFGLGACMVRETSGLMVSQVSQTEADFAHHLGELSAQLNTQEFQGGEGVHFLPCFKKGESLMWKYSTLWYFYILTSSPHAFITRTRRCTVSWSAQGGKYNSKSSSSHDFH